MDKVGGQKIGANQENGDLAVANADSISSNHFEPGAICWSDQLLMAHHGETALDACPGRRAIVVLGGCS